MNSIRLDWNGVRRKLFLVRTAAVEACRPSPLSQSMLAECRA